MGQIKNIKLHIVTDIKTFFRSYSNMASNKRKSESASKTNALATLQRLSDAEKSALLENLINNPSEDATNLVLKKRKVLDATPISESLLKGFGSRAYRAIHQLDRLRPSQQFNMIGQV